MSDRSQAWVNAALLLLLFLTMQGTITAGIATFDARILNDLRISRGALKLRDVVQMMSASLFGILIGYATSQSDRAISRAWAF